MEQCNVSIRTYCGIESRTITKAIVDNVVWYKAVFTHVKSCEVCDPSEILNSYLDRRIKKNVYTSTILSELIMKYEKLGIDKSKPISDELIRTFLSRSANLRILNKYNNRLNLSEIRSVINNWIKAENQQSIASLKNPRFDLKDPYNSILHDFKVNAWYVPRSMDPTSRVMLLIKALACTNADLLREFDEKQLHDMTSVVLMHMT